MLIRTLITTGIALAALAGCNATPDTSANNASAPAASMDSADAQAAGPVEVPQTEAELKQAMTGGMDGAEFESAFAGEYMYQAFCLHESHPRVHVPGRGVIPRWLGPRRSTGDAAERDRLNHIRRLNHQNAESGWGPVR